MHPQILFIVNCVYLAGSIVWMGSSSFLCWGKLVHCLNVQFICFISYFEVVSCLKLWRLRLRHQNNFLQTSNNFFTVSFRGKWRLAFKYILSWVLITSILSIGDLVMIAFLSVDFMNFYNKIDNVSKTKKIKYKTQQLVSILFQFRYPITWLSSSLFWLRHAWFYYGLPTCVLLSISLEY